MTLTFNGSAAEVVIFKEGKRFDRENLPYFFNSITNVEIVNKSKEASTIGITFEPSFQDGLKILESGLLGRQASKKGQKPPESIESNSSVEKVAKPAENFIRVLSAADTASSSPESGNPFFNVKLMYPGQTLPSGEPAETGFYTGMAEVPSLDLSDGTISIKINAVASPAFLSMVEGSVKFENANLKEALEFLVEPMNLKVFAGSDETAEILENNKINGVFNEPRMQIIRKILFRNSCFYTMVSQDESSAQNSSIMIKSLNEISQSKIKYTFVLYRQIDPSRNIIPITSISLDGENSLFVSGAFGSFQRGVNESSKEIEQVKVGPESLQNKSLSSSGKTGGALPSSEPVGGGSTGIVNGSDPELTGSSTPVYIRKNNSNRKSIEEETKQSIFNGIKYDLVLPGLPDLNVLDTCQVIIGDFIPGISAAGYITEVTHSYGGEGWVTNCRFVQSSADIDASIVEGFSEKSIATPANVVSDQQSNKISQRIV